jgi:hypothetical protein
MPGRLWIALVLLGIQTLWWGWAVFVGPHVVGVVWFSLAVVFLVYLPRGHPLARQWGLYVAGFQFLLGVAVTLFASTGSAVGLLVAVSGGLLWWGLSGQAVRRYFDLYCIGCGSYRTRPRSLLYNRIGCRDCGRRWKRGDAVESVESVFE